MRKKTVATLTQADTKFVIYNSSENKILLMDNMSSVEDYLESLPPENAEDIDHMLVFKVSDIYRPSRLVKLNSIINNDSAATLFDNPSV